MGGALVELGGWRWAFLINLPFGVVAIVATRRTVVESRAPGRRVMPDIPGALMLAAGLGLLNLGVIKGNDWGWTSPRVLGAFAIAALLGVLFVRSSRRHRAPVVDPELVRIPTFRTASVATILGGLGFYAYLLTNILWLQYVWGYDVLRAGFALVPGALVAAVVAARLGPIAERVGYRVLVVPGALVWAGAYLWYHQMVGLTPAFWSEWLPGQVLSGVGVGATLPLLTSAALASVPGGRYATASALVSSARQLGGVLGISILVLIVGNPTGAGVVDALREGWMLSIIAFLAVAVVAIPIGKVVARPEAEDVEHGSPLLLLPDVSTSRPLRPGVRPRRAWTSSRSSRRSPTTPGRPSRPRAARSPSTPGVAVPRGRPRGLGVPLEERPARGPPGQPGRADPDPGGGRGRALAPHRRTEVRGHPRGPGRDPRRGPARGLRGPARPGPGGDPDRADADRRTDAHGGCPGAPRAAAPAAGDRRRGPARGQRRRGRRPPPEGPAGHAPLGRRPRAVGRRGPRPRRGGQRPRPAGVRRGRPDRRPGLARVLPAPVGCRRPGGAGRQRRPGSPAVARLPTGPGRDRRGARSLGPRRVGGRHGRLATDRGRW